MEKGRLFLVVVHGQIVFLRILLMLSLTIVFFIREWPLFTAGGSLQIGRGAKFSTSLKRGGGLFDGM